MSDAMFDEVNPLIDKREEPGNLDKAVRLLEELKQKHPGKDLVRGKLSHAYFYKGRFADEGSRDRIDLFKRGMDYGKEAITLNPKAVYGNYWYASNMGMWGLCRGIMSSLKGIDPMRKSMQVVLGENENFFFGGPHRALGRLYHQAPGWPISIGNKGKAAEHLERAVAIGPDFMHNRLFLAEFLLDVGKKDKAREHIQWIIDRPLHPDHEIEDGVYKEQAREMAQKVL